MQQLEYEFCNAIGFVFDTTIEPRKQLGQAFLVSKSRMVTNASTVFHYTEAPWALSVHFPFSDVKIPIKAVNLHNDFDKVTARAHYLNSQGLPGELKPMYMNDIAMLIIDPNPPEVPKDRVSELNRALSLPFSGEGVEASGNLRGAEFMQIIQTALEAGREGLLTLFDSRNIPLAHILLARGGILKVFFQQVMSSEMAFCELVYRQPAYGFAFKPGSSIEWGDVPDVQTAPDRLIYEAMRRANDIPNLFQQLGGKDARYQQVVQNFDPEAASDEIRWMVQPLWQGLDGYVSLDKLARRVGVDTYTVLIAIRELVNRGVVSQINRISPFPCTGQIGSPLISHTDFEVHPWDPLQAFYLDAVSGAPTWLEGNFFGVANSLQPKNMLHTIGIPKDATGALILKDYKLIGIHSSEQILKPGQPAPPVKCYQFMWMGALLDLSTRKVRSGTDEDEGGVGSLRTISDTETQAPPENTLKIQCPNCFAMNPEYGTCITCGATIEAPVEEPEPENKILASKPMKEIRKLQKKHGISNKQAAIGLAVVCLPILLIPMCSGGGGGGGGSTQQPTEAPPEAQQAPSKTRPSDKKAVELAVEEAGFSATAPPMYWYQDTSEITSPTPSFGLYSEQANQKLLFIVYNDDAPVKQLRSFAGKPPYTTVDRADLGQAIVDSGNQILGATKLEWVLGKYQKPQEKGDPLTVPIMLASFPGAKEGKSVLLVGQAMDDSGARTYNHKTSLFVLDELASELTGQAIKDKKIESSAKTEDDEEDEDFAEDSAKTDMPVKQSTEEEIDAFIEKAAPILQEALVLPDNIQEMADGYEAEFKEPKKWKNAGLLIGVDREGLIKRIQVLNVKTDDQTDTINKALEKAVQKVATFKDPPVVKELEFQFKVRLKGKEVDLKKEL